MKVVVHPLVRISACGNRTRMETGIRRATTCTSSSTERRTRTAIISARTAGSGCRRPRGKTVSNRNAQLDRSETARYNHDMRPDSAALRNAVLCPRCGQRGTWDTYDGVTFCVACRFWYSGYYPYTPRPRPSDELLSAMSAALRDLIEWRQFGARLCSEYLKQGRDPGFVPLCPTDSAMEKTENVCFALAKQITKVRKSNVEGQHHE